MTVDSGGTNGDNINREGTARGDETSVVVAAASSGYGGYSGRDQVGSSPSTDQQTFYWDSDVHSLCVWM